jgi:hypothetical protein
MKQIRFSVAICAVATLAVFVADAQAQRGGPGGMMRMVLGGGGGQLHSELLAMEQVQAEIKLTDEQQEKIVAKAKELFNAFQSEKREIMQDGGDAAKVGELLKAKQDEEKEIVASLNDDQKKRLRQLMVQRMGNGAFQNAKIAKELGISDDQKKEIKKAVETAAETMQKAMEEARESRDFASIRTAITDMQKKLTESLMGVMNDKQKSKYKEMRGEKFEFPQRQRRRRN